MAYIEIFGPSVGGTEITGTGAAGQVTYFTGPQSIASDSGLTYTANGGPLSTTGVFNAGAGTAALPALTVGQTNKGLYSIGANELGISVGSAVRVRMTTGTFGLDQSQSIAWGSSGVNSQDLFLVRDAANTLAQRNGGTSGTPVTQAFSLYNWYTDGSNYRYVQLVGSYTGNNVGVYAHGAGTGANGSLYLAADASVFLAPGGGTNGWQVENSTVAFKPTVDNSYPFGDATHRASNVFSVIGTFTSLTGVSNVLNVANGSNTQHLRIYGSEALSRYLDISCDTTSITFQSAASVTSYFFGLNGTYSLVYDGNGIYPNTDNTSAVGITSKRYAAGNFVTLNTNTVAGTAGSLTLNPFSTNPVFITTSLQVGVVTNGTGSFYEGSDTNVDNRWDSASATATAATSLSFRRAKGSQAARTIVASGDRVGLIEFDGWNGTSYDSAVVLRAIIDQTPGASGDMPGRFEILTTPDGSATPTIALTADRAQNIGLMNNLAFNGATGHISVYENISTVGFGVPAIFAAGRLTAQTAAQASVSTYTVGAADGSFEVSANVNVTTSTAHTFTVTIAYTDEGNTSRTLTAGFTQLSGATFLTAITNVTGAGPYESPVYHIRCKAATAITIATVGTFTTVTYNVEGIIKQMA